LTDTHRAVKTVRKDNVLDYQAFKKKLEDLFDLNHPRLIKLVGFLEDDEEAHLVFELCTGPDLFDKMLEIRESGQRMPLQEVRHMLRQMMQAVVACKEHGLVHRDIRPENFMIESREKQGLDSSIKFIDLGLSREEFVKDKPCTGPLLYTAPECIKGQYGERSDTWSLGAIFFLMLTGGTLFDQQNCEDGLSKMLESEYCPRPWLGKIKPDTHHWVTEDAIDLLRRMVKTNPVERISVEEALQHPFMSCSMEEFQEQQTLRFPTALLGKIEPWTHRWVTGDAKDLFWSLVETGMCVEDALPQAFMACTAQSFEERGCGISLK